MIVVSIENKFVGHKWLLLAPSSMSCSLISFRGLLVVKWYGLSLLALRRQTLMVRVYPMNDVSGLIRQVRKIHSCGVPCFTQSALSKKMRTIEV
jgi:hypothetical protein